MKKLVVFSLLVAACGGEASVVEVGPQPMAPQPQQPQPQPLATATVQVQVAPAGPGLMNTGEDWMGQYRCAQGATDLDLHLDAVNGSQIDATFIFAHGPSGAAGSFKMRGTITPDGQVTLVPGAWVAQPPNYMSVGMSGVVRGTTFRGRIDNASCGAFIVHRSAT